MDLSRRMWAGCDSVAGMTQFPEEPPAEYSDDDAPFDDGEFTAEPFIDSPGPSPARTDHAATAPAPGPEPARTSHAATGSHTDSHPAPHPAPHPLTDPAVSDVTEVRDQAEHILRTLVGDRPGRPAADVRLREDQWRAIEALVVRRARALVVQRTGWGKSAVYFVATALLRELGEGPTVIVSPLLALMRDQVAAAERAGIRAVTINSTNVTQWDDVHARIAAGEVDVLLCSPERLNNPAFRDEVLPRLSADAGLVVVDEAHCVSDWGHDFRPDYRRIRTLLEELPDGVPVLATTATANERVTRDVAEQLGVRGAEAGHDPQEVLVLRGSLDRPALHLGVVHLPDQAARVAWLADQLGRWEGSGIVYTLTVAAAGEVAELLRAAGHDARAYTGQTEPAEREALEADLKADRVKTLVATSALGMGFDKPDLRFVVHLGAPSSPVAYYQQVGRAGRAVERADVVLLPGTEDQDIWAYFGSLSFPPPQTVREVLAALGDAAEAGEAALSTARLETVVDLRRTRLEQMLKVLDVDGAVRRVRGGWTSTGREWEYDAQRYARVDEARRREQAAMLDYERLAPGTCRMAFLRAQLDDPDLAPGWTCGRCDLCGGLDVSEAVDSGTADRTRAALTRPGIEVEPRRQWPTGMAALGLGDLRGKIGAEESMAAGRAIGRTDGLGLGNVLRELFEGSVEAPVEPATELDERGLWTQDTPPAARGRDGRVSEALRRPLADVLRDWREGSGVTALGAVDGVVVIASARRPVLVRHLARGVSQLLDAPLVGAVVPDPDRPPASADVNSARRLADVARRLRLDLPADVAGSLAGRRIVVVDDYTDTGWTLAVAARLLRLAGAAQVWPFVLAQR